MDMYGAKLQHMLHHEFMECFYSIYKDGLFFHEYFTIFYQFKNLKLESLTYFRHVVFSTISILSFVSMQHIK